MPKISKFLFFIIFTLCLFNLNLTQAQHSESLSIVTYYPSPYGSYRELRTKRMAIGDDYIKTGSPPDKYDWQEYATDPMHNIGYDADLIVQGNVGIGTANPSGKLEVAPNAYSSLSISDAGDEMDNKDNVGIDLVKPDTKEVCARILLNGYFNSSDVGGKINFYTKELTGTLQHRMIILENGNVGIGTTNPQTKAGESGLLDVQDVWLRDANGGSGAWASESGGAAYLLYRDVEPSGTWGMELDRNVWQTRPLTEETVDSNNNGSLSSNRITLKAGTYECYILCPLLDGNGEPKAHQARLYNVSDSRVIAYGTSEYSEVSGWSMSYSTIFARFTLASAKTVRIEHRQSGNTTNVFLGRPNSFGGGEVYTIAQFRKVK